MKCAACKSGNWADLKESLLPLDVYRCGTGKRVELFDLDLSLPVQQRD
jgi:hypothetical protein